MNSKPRCPICRVSPALCVCAQLPRLALPFHVVVIQHGQEARRQSNTGALVHRLLVDSCIVRQTTAGKSGVALADFEGEDWATHVLFPTPGASPVSPALLDLAPGRRFTLVLLDATWRQARRMSRRIPGLRRRPFVTLPEGLSPRWPLRQPTCAGQLSTVEATAWATYLLGFPDEARSLWNALELVARRIFELRGKLPREPMAPLIGGRLY